MPDFLCPCVLFWIIKTYFSILLSVLHAQREAKVMMLRNLSLVTFLKEPFLLRRKKFSCHFFNLNVKVKFFRNLYKMCTFDTVTYIQVGLKLLLILND